MNIALMREKAEQLKQLGMTRAANDLSAKAELARKLAIGYEHFRVVTKEKLAEYREKLVKATTKRVTADDVKAEMSGKYLVAMEDSMRWNRGLADEWHYENVARAQAASHDELVLDALDKYAGVPPQDALEKLAEAKGKGVFDAFVVAHVEPVASRVKLPDPIIFGTITGCTDYFYVCEWGNDVSISDILSNSEG